MPDNKHVVKFTEDYTINTLHVTNIILNIIV